MFWKAGSKTRVFVTSLQFFVQRQGLRSANHGTPWNTYFCRIPVSGLAIPWLCQSDCVWDVFCLAGVLDCQCKGSWWWRCAFLLCYFLLLPCSSHSPSLPFLYNLLCKILGNCLDLAWFVWFYTCCLQFVSWPFSDLAFSHSISVSLLLFLNFQ